MKSCQNEDYSKGQSVLRERLINRGKIMDQEFGWIASKHLYFSMMVLWTRDLTDLGNIYC